MGDCYEAFFEDAETCSEVCDLALSVRHRGNNFIPLAGIHYSMLNQCRKKILQAGYKLAVLQQIKGPQGSKRDVVVISQPGAAP